MDARLAPPAGRGHFSVARATRWWYVACQSHELGRTPIARTVLGMPLVLFRDAHGRAAALVDRCPHRNVPLSLGRVAGDGTLECAYHGWRFDGAGACRLVPGLLGDADGRARRAAHHAVRELDGLVWVYGEADAAPATEPFALPGGPGYATVVRELEMPCTLHAAVENALDVPHTAFLHRGLFRGGTPHEIVAVVRRGADRVEAEFQGEPRPEGLIGRFLAPGGGVVEHWDRFVLPSIAQVEYRLGTENHLLVTAFCTPVSDFVTRLISVVRFRLRLPAWLVRPVVVPLATRILRQDQAILGRQTEIIRHFGGEQYANTELDLLGPHVWRLLREAEAGTVPAEAPAGFERRIRFMA